MQKNKMFSVVAEIVYGKFQMRKAVKKCSVRESDATVQCRVEFVQGQLLINQFYNKITLFDVMGGWMYLKVGVNMVFGVLLKSFIY